MKKEVEIINVLLIGNGFDLAHGLPTRYIDFLDFLDIFINMEGYHGAFDNFHNARITNNEKFTKNCNWRKLEGFIIKIYDEVYTRVAELRKTTPVNLNELFEVAKNNKLCEEFFHLLGLKNNFWYKHFKEKRSNNLGWIDFENEISNVVKTLKNAAQGEAEAQNIINKMTTTTGGKFTSSSDATKRYRDFRDFLLEQLLSFTDGLESYLRLFVEELELTSISPDINDINYVLNFNYTNTFKKIYGDIKNFQIHGIVNTSKTGNKCNIVLGIDDFDDSHDTFYIQFKKFYQRIHRQCDFDYVTFLNNLESNLKKDLNLELEYNLFIFGHSLDVTDKDILKQFICMEKMITKVFYHNEEVFGSYIENLVKVLGKDVFLLKFQKGEIKFEKQGEMMPLK